MTWTTRKQRLFLTLFYELEQQNLLEHIFVRIVDMMQEGFWAYSIKSVVRKRTGLLHGKLNHKLNLRSRDIAISNQIQDSHIYPQLPSPFSSTLALSNAAFKSAAHYWKHSSKSISLFKSIFLKYDMLKNPSSRLHVFSCHL